MYTRRRLGVGDKAKQGSCGMFPIRGGRLEGGCRLDVGKRKENNSLGGSFPKRAAGAVPLRRLRVWRTGRGLEGRLKLLSIHRHSPPPPLPPLPPRSASWSPLSQPPLMRHIRLATPAYLTNSCFVRERCMMQRICVKKRRQNAAHMHLVSY